MICIVDYGMGNLQSVANALEAIGAKAQISSDPAVLRAADKLILPGVGAFGEAMARLRERDLINPLDEEVKELHKPILGICLGMQLLADVSFEHGEHRGLGWIPGEVRRIDAAGPRTHEGHALRVPHIGWSAVVTHGRSALLEKMPPEPTFYFVHSFQLVAKDPAVVTGTCDYGGPLTAVVEHGHVLGTQFHPEKSQKAGLQLLRNFVAWEGAR